MYTAIAMTNGSLSQIFCNMEMLTVRNGLNKSLPPKNRYLHTAKRMEGEIMPIHVVITLVKFSTS
jgi:hypothetical protein